MSKNQFTGAYLSVVESLAKLVAAGFEHEKAYLSFQEYLYSSSWRFCGRIVDRYWR